MPRRAWPLAKTTCSSNSTSPNAFVTSPLVLVTGATGLLGGPLVRALLADGQRVRILRRHASRLDLLGDAAHQVEHALGDVTDSDSVYEAMQGVHHVYHAAGFVNFDGDREAERLWKVNGEGTAHVVNAALARGVKRLVHTSSIAALGRPEKSGETIDETRAWTHSKANSVYAETKHAAELEVQRAVAEGLDAVLVNPSLIFGVGRSGDNTIRIAEQIRDGKVPAIPTGSTNVVDAEDVARGHLLAMQRGQTGERYLLGGPNLTWREIIETFARAFEVAPPHRTFNPRLARWTAVVSEAVAFVTRTRPLITKETARTASSRYHYDTAKAERELGYTFRPFEETARRIAASLG